MTRKLSGWLVQSKREDGRYGRVLVQDSTVIRLPTRLFEIERFSGVANQHTSPYNAKIHHVPENQLRIFVTARLIMTVICHRALYGPARAHLKYRGQVDISMMTLMTYLSKKIERVPGRIISLRKQETEDPAIAAIARHCTCDRRKRLMLKQIMDEMIER